MAWATELASVSRHTEIRSASTVRRTECEGQYGGTFRWSRWSLSIALSLVAASPAAAQRPSDLVHRKLSAVIVIDGIACGATGRAYAYFHPSGRLAECPLATAATSQ